MSYTNKNFKTKKSIKKSLEEKEIIRCHNPGIGPDLSNFTGKIFLEGPHYPEPHRWYAEAWLENGILVKIK